MKKISKLISIFSIISIMFTALCGMPALATGSLNDPCDQEGLSPTVAASLGCKDHASSDTLPAVIVSILKGVIGTAALVAVIFIIIGGVSYMTSTGDPGKIKKAKDTILYAVVGLVICALAFAIVTFVTDTILKDPETEDDTQSSLQIQG